MDTKQDQLIKLPYEDAQVIAQLLMEGVRSSKHGALTKDIIHDVFERFFVYTEIPEPPVLEAEVVALVDFGSDSEMHGRFTLSNDQFDSLLFLPELEDEAIHCIDNKVVLGTIGHVRIRFPLVDREHNALTGPMPDAAQIAEIARNHLADLFPTCFVWSAHWVNSNADSQRVIQTNLNDVVEHNYFVAAHKWDALIDAGIPTEVALIATCHYPTPIEKLGLSGPLVVVRIDGEPI